LRVSVRRWVAVGAACLGPTFMGCTGTYGPVVRPIPRLSVLSPELENLTDAKIETYLRADVRPVFPSVLAVAKVAPVRSWNDGAWEIRLEVQVLRGDEAEGWRNMAGPQKGRGGVLLEQVQFVSPMLAGGDATLKTLRDAAALLHAPLLLVYMQENNAAKGHNDAAMAYWTIVGLFCVPGNTVGHYSVCQAILIDTRSGFILATAEGESKREENVPPAAVKIAAQRVRRESWADAVAKLQEQFRSVLAELAVSRGLGSEPQGL
jgi:hypothetical protein